MFLSESVERVFKFQSIGNSTLKKLPPFYSQVLVAWLSMCNKDDIVNLTSKIVYRNIQPDIKHRCMSKFRGYKLDWPALWRDLEICFIDKPMWKANFLSLHEVLPMANRLVKWGLTPRTVTCHCGQLENQEHLFKHCTLTLVLINWFEELLRRKWPNHCLSNAHIWFNFPACAGIPSGFKFILATLRHYVWVARNSWQFEGTHPDPQVLVEKIESTFRFVSKVQYSQFFDQRFTRKNGSLGEC